MQVSFLPFPEAGSLAISPAIEEIVAEGNADACRTQPRESVLALHEIILVSVGVVVIQAIDAATMVFWDAVYERVVLCPEIADLQTEVKAPVTIFADREDVAGTDTSTEAFADPAFLGIEAELIEKGVDVALQVPSLEGRLARGLRESEVTIAEVTVAEVVAGFELIVVELEVLMVGGVANPPREVERGAEGPVTVARIILESDVRHRTEAVLRDVSHEFEQVGLDRNPLTAVRTLLWNRDGHLWIRHLGDANVERFRLQILGMERSEVVGHDTDGTKQREVVAEQADPQAAAVEGLEFGLEVDVVVSILLDEVIDSLVSVIMTKAHHLDEEEVFLVGYIEVDSRRIEASLLEEIIERLITADSETMVVRKRSFWRGGRASEQNTVRS